MAPGLSERLAAACAEVDAACQMLLSPTPEQLDQCSGRLTAAISAIRSCQANPGLRFAGASPLAEAHRLLKSVRRAHQLLEGAAAFHDSWIRHLGAMCAGYTGDGQPAAVERGSRVFARG